MKFFYVIAFMIFSSVTFAGSVQECNKIKNSPKVQSWVSADQFGKVYATNYQLLVSTDVRESDDGECGHVSWTYAKCVVEKSTNKVTFKIEKTKEELRCSYYP